MNIKLIEKCSLGRKRSLHFIIRAFIFFVCTNIFSFTTESSNELRIQQIQVSGKVVDQNDQPLPGATILIKGTVIGTQTDFDGLFELEIPKNNATLVVSYIGYTTVEVQLNGQTSITIKLEEDANALDEIVVVGYGTQKESSLTGAIARIENTNLDQQAVGNVEQTLMGRMAGLSIRQSTTSPGESLNISIRGTTSITGSNDPLIVIDGFPGGDLNSLNTGDIESIEVLKDASSAAIYGSRAAGGVIIVTTKMGSKEKPTFTFNTFTGIKSAINLYDDILNTQEAYDYDLKRNDVDWIQSGGDPNVPVEDRPNDYRPDERRLDFADTDWQDEMLRDSFIRNYELSARGGSDVLKYYISGNYLDEESTFAVGDFKRYSLRVNLSTKFSENFKMGLNLYSAYTDQRRNTLVINSIVKYPSSIPMYLPEGETVFGGPYAHNRYYFNNGTSLSNPYAASVGTFDYYKKLTTQANLFLEFNIADGLAFRTSMGVRYKNSKNPYFRATYANKSGLTRADYEYDDNLNVLNENLLTYNKSFGSKHQIDALIGASFQKENQFDSYSEVMEGSIPDNKIQTLNAGIVSIATTTEGEWGLISYFSRINYAYDNKYLISASYRTDGSSRFGSDRKWGNFPALSLGWNVHKENFFDNVSFISKLKLKASYGVTGRTPNQNYLPYARIQSNNYTLGGSLINGATQGTFGNSQLGWERTEEINLGLNLGLLKNRLIFTADVYKRNTSDLLLSTPIPSITGFDTTTANVGEVMNKGVELGVNARIFKGDFKWTSIVNYSRNINEVVDLGGLNRLPLSQDGKGMWFQTKVGQPIGQFFGWVQQGVWVSNEEVANNPSAPGAKQGSIRIKDMNGDGEIDADDRAPLGSYMPDFEVGFINEFKYKNFDLSILTNGVFGFEVYNFELDYYNNARKLFTENRWFSPDEPGDGKRVGNTKGVPLGSSDYYVEDGSYWGFRNIIMGYTLPKGVGGDALSAVRIYFSVQNAAVFTIGDFNSYNPEGFTQNRSDLTKRGTNYGAEPLNRTVSFGINLTF